MATLIPALLFGLLGAVLLLMIVRGLLTPILGSSVKGLLSRWRINKKIKQLAKIDKAIQLKSLDQALDMLKEAFYLEQVKIDKRFVAYVHNHNVSVLGRVVTVAEKRGGHMHNLALVEGLFQSRRELMESYLETLDVKKAVARKRKEQGKDIPNWSSGGFQEKLDEIRDNIFTNKRSIKAQLQEAFKLLGTMHSQEEITYH